MPLYAAICFDHPPHALALRDHVRAAHRAYVLDNAAPIRCAGAMRDADSNQCGTIYVFEAMSEADVRAWFAVEPFHAAGVYESVRVAIWSPAFNVLTTCDWPVASTPTDMLTPSSAPHSPSASA